MMCSDRKNVLPKRRQIWLMRGEHRSMMENSESSFAFSKSWKSGLGGLVSFYYTFTRVCRGELVIVPPSLLILCMYAYCGQSGWDQILICCLEICIFRRQSIFPTCSSSLLLDLAWRKPLLFNSILDLRKMTMETNLILWSHGKNISKILCKPTFNATA